ncbi:hypothetical protein [Burkholderia anthina]|uniref:hypothetical protein n=1 Tax=Burkholderia anthina TaxID=179879 RepID=UPI0015884F9A|nr:hypothetical protein [Burkholderia anthina]
MDLEKLKQIGREILQSMKTDRVRATTRSNLRSVIVCRIQARVDLVSEESRRYVGNFLMAQYGYGGGI